jgi:capsid protein
MAAMLSAFITRKDPQSESYREAANAQLDAAEGKTTARTAQERAMLDLAPGMLFELEEGESIEQINPTHPSTQYEAKLHADLQLICANAGLPLELAYYKFTNNYAASRSAISAAWLGVRNEQRALRDKFLNRVTRWRLRIAVRRGELPYVPDWDKFRWELPNQPSLDYGSDVKAVVDAISGEVSTRGDALNRLGSTGTAEDFYTERARELERERELGIVTKQPATVSVSTTGDVADDAARGANV